MLCYEFRIHSPVQKSAKFKEKNEQIEVKYLIVQQINGKMLSDQNQHFF